MSLQRFETWIIWLERTSGEVRMFTRTSWCPAVEAALEQMQREEDARDAE